MPEQEENKQNVQAEDNSLAVGDIRVGGSAGNINISNVTNIYNAPEKEAQSKEPVAGDPPYMGLRYFDTQDADLFYGREALTRELLARVQKESFLAIVGASGSGKSSVARAGLIPAWKQENERSVVHVITPTAHPLESLAASLTRESESVTATSTLMDDLSKDSRSLRLYVKKVGRSARPNPMLLLVDQFEETFTLCKDIEERKAFIENLLYLADDDSARVVITLRADFYHHCAEYEGLRTALQAHQIYIGAMTTDELRQAITTPAEKNGWDFQPGLVDLILSDVGAEPGALPLLSHALLETWKRRQGHTLTLQGYHKAGGVKKAIAQTAESVYDRLTPAEQIIARGIFLRLIELGEGLQGTRRRAKLDELSRVVETQDSIAKVLKILTDARLVTTAQDSAEVAHEALIREWGTLRKWLDEDRESLRLHRHLTESAGEWQRRGKEASELYRGARLKQLQGWLKEHGDGLSPLEREFVKASQNVKKRERLKWAAIISAGVALLLLVIFMPTGMINRLIYQPVDMEDYWVTIPAGEFQMGSENDTITEMPVHTVYLDAYQIGKYEITNRQYNNCRKAGICPGITVSTNLDHPVVNVSWFNAKTYCEWVGGRLPTEAEWEKAARGTDGRTYPWGEGIDCGKANYQFSDKANFIYICVGGTSPVGSYESGKSPYGLYDMAGNALEWVNDEFNNRYYQESPLSNPLGPNPGSSRVLRGGSWSSDDFEVRSSIRRGNTPNDSSNFVGFRCARDVPQSPEDLLTATAFMHNYFLQATPTTVP